jgi:propanol-preferring alcohol dehydrogenase
MVNIPRTQTAATVPKLGGGVVFDHNYPVPQPKHNEVLAKVLYSGVCQSGKHKPGLYHYTHSGNQYNVNKR